MSDTRRKRRHGFKNEESYREELRQRDRIRQAYYLSLSDPEPEIDPDPVDFSEPSEPPKEPVYFTRLLTRGWFEVVGPEGVVSDKKMRLPEAETMAKDLNDGLNG